MKNRLNAENYSAFWGRAELPRAGRAAGRDQEHDQLPCTRAVPPASRARAGGAAGEVRRGGRNRGWTRMHARPQGVKLDRDVGGPFGCAETRRFRLAGRKSPSFPPDNLGWCRQQVIAFPLGLLLVYPWWVHRANDGPSRRRCPGFPGAVRAFDSTSMDGCFADRLPRV